MDISNDELESLLQKKVATERQITIEIIQLLEQVSKRRIYLERGYGSLIEYCIKKLGYSESAAYRRVAAMKLARELPQIKEEISLGRINLANVAKAQTYFQQEERQGDKISTAEKRKVLESLVGKSVRQAEVIFADLNPESSRPEKVRILNSEQTQVTVTLDAKLIQQLQEIRELISHRHPSLGYAELIAVMAEMSLTKLKYSRCAQLSTKTRSATGAGGAKQKPVGKRFVPAALRRQVWQKAHGRCCYVDLKSGRVCGSRFQLQIEHRIPFAKGGRNNIENLELLCSAHNHLRAVQVFGEQKMVMSISGAQ